MRKVILSGALSLDGYIARPDGSVDFLVMPEGGEQELAKLFARIDTIVLGRKTLDAQEQHNLGEPPREHWKTYVFSRSHPLGEGKYGVIFVNRSPAEFVAELRRTDGKDIFHMGGGELARAFLEVDLIDEIEIAIIPVLLGEGIPLFPSGFPQREFTLLESKAYKNGVVWLKYERRQ